MNINDNVRVRLTPYARVIERRNHDEIMKDHGLSLPFIPNPEDADGWSTWHLWELMATFGKHCFMGSRQLFDQNEIWMVEPPPAVEERKRGPANCDKCEHENGYHPPLFGCLKHHRAESGANKDGNCQDFQRQKGWRSWLRHYFNRDPGCGATGMG